MRRILRSKPVVLGTVAALGSKVLKGRSRKQQRSKLTKKVSTFAVLGLAGGVWRYFSNPIDGPTRRTKVKKLFGGGDQTPEWQSSWGSNASTSGSSSTGATDSPTEVTIPDTTPSSS